MVVLKRVGPVKGHEVLAEREAAGVQRSRKSDVLGRNAARLSRCLPSEVSSSLL